MGKQLLIYEKAVPVSKDKHRDWSVKTGTDYAFAKHVNSVPLTAVEFPIAAPEYAVVFTGTEEAVMPAVILGIRNEENVYLTDTGGWRAKYVPAFLRRYPFVFSSTNDGNSFTLCIDEDFAGCNTEGRGERLFDADGQRTQYLERSLEFIRQYQAQFQLTQAFCKKLKELDLLEPMQVQFSMGSGQKMSLAGFMAVSRDRLKKLSGDQLAELAKTDQLELVYMHLQSMTNFRAMIERINDTETPEKSGSLVKEEPKPEIMVGEKSSTGRKQATSTAKT